jgi:hypothetical protein
VKSLEDIRLKREKESGTEVSSAQTRIINEWVICQHNTRKIDAECSKE